MYTALDPRVPSTYGLPPCEALQTGNVCAMHSRWAEHSSTLTRAIRDDDERMVEDAVRTLSQSRRIFAPLAFVVGAFVMLFDGVKLLFSNWRLASCSYCLRCGSGSQHSTSRLTRIAAHPFVN